MLSCPRFGWWNTWNEIISWGGKGNSFPLRERTLQGAEGKGHFLPAGFQIKCSLCFPGVHIQKKKNHVVTLKTTPRELWGDLIMEQFTGREQRVLSPRVTKQPIEKALFHAWATPHAPDRGFLFHTELCFHIYCCKCFRATGSWRVRFLTGLESR